MAIELENYIEGLSVVPSPSATADHLLIRTAAGNLGRVTPQSLPGNRPSGDWSLVFTEADVSHVNHGLFWQPGVEYTDCFWEALIKPSDGAEHFISAGYGGNHCLLFGAICDSTGATLYANMFNSDTATLSEISTIEKIRPDEWAHVAVGFDGTRIVLFINGVPSSRLARTAPRKTADAFEGTLFVGGSDHSMFAGSVGAIRGFEGSIPIPSLVDNSIRPAVNRITRPSVSLSGSMIDAAFVADYRKGDLRDYSSGLAGVLHHGVFGEANVDISGEAGQYQSQLAYDRDPTKYPVWALDPFAFSNTAAAQKTQIAGTRIYDDFSRADVHYGNSASLGLGTTRVGGKAWSGTAYGILNGLAYCNASAFTSAIFTVITDAGSGNEDGTIIWRRPVASMPAGESSTYSFLFRYVDANNYTRLTIDEFGQGNVYEYSSGTPTQLGGTYTFSTDWTEVKVVLAGTALTVYKDGASLGGRTMTANLTATSKGMALAGTMLRISEFGVI